MYLMDLKTPEKYILCKIGYTYTLDNREKSICNDFGCNLYPVGFMEINSEADEKRFHKLIENKYPHLPYVINKKRKKTDTVHQKFEIYKLDKVLFDEFFTYNINLNNNIVLIEQEKTKQEQELTKQEQEKTKQIVEQEKTKQEQEKTKQIVEQEITKQLLLKLYIEAIKSKKTEV